MVTFKQRLFVIEYLNDVSYRWLSVYKDNKLGYALQLCICYNINIISWDLNRFKEYNIHIYQSSYIIDNVIYIYININPLLFADQFKFEAYIADIIYVPHSLPYSVSGRRTLPNLTCRLLFFKHCCVVMKYAYFIFTWEALILQFHWRLLLLSFFLLSPPPSHCLSLLSPFTPLVLSDII